MSSEINELIWYPEIKQYLLVNNYLNTETRVTMSQLKKIFSQEDLDKILTNRNDYWSLTTL